MKKSDLSAMILGTTIAGMGLSAASALEFEDACLAGAPEGTPPEIAEAYCSCMAEATAEDAEVQAELEAAWPITGTIEEWVATLSPEAAAVSASCAP
ncbi:hypothetical protein [Maricaulis parjimensis]|uniref:hypothetical protein n=1 Tax=Maricaulis parjimensis TaxID=144023 RepID=UPI00193A4C7F|nr:hypothetical protein [Maricaulis parjimensis]